VTYRSADAVLKERLAELDRELVGATARERELTAECEAMDRAVKDLDERLALSGVGGASRGPTFDRISVLVNGLCIVGLLVVPAEIYIGGYVHRQPEETVVPILMLAGPGTLAALIAWPYRAIAPYGKGVVIGAALAFSAVFNVALGFLR
jgi:hypothetical protein